MLAESTTRLRDPQLRQRAMNPEPVAARFVTAHDRRLRRQPEPRVAPAAARCSTARTSPLATVRSHGVTPNPDVIASFQSFLPNSNATYNVGSLTLSLRAGRCNHHSLLLALNTLRSLIARPAHSLSCLVAKYRATPPGASESPDRRQAELIPTRADVPSI